MLDAAVHGGKLPASGETFMPRARQISASLENVITQLAEERQAHVDAVAAIAALLERWGIRLPARRRAGRRPRTRRTTARQRKAAHGAARRRRRLPGRKMTRSRAPYGETSDAIVKFVSKAGAKGVSSAELAAFLARRGSAQNPFATIGRLVRTKRLKKRAAKGQRGSVYVVS
jgi:hypothetical protein